MTIPFSYYFVYLSDCQTDSVILYNELRVKGQVKLNEGPPWRTPAVAKVKALFK